MIKVISPDEVLGTARASLGLAETSHATLDEGYLASALRRLAGFLCPCSPKTLLRSMVDSHRGLMGDETAFSEQAEDVIEKLVAIGDLLELRDVTLEGDAVKGTWLVAAPPSFVARPNGGAFILGLAADEQTPLPTELRARISYTRAIRFIPPDGSGDILGSLRELGVRELSEASWLKTPKKLSAIDLLSTFNSRLSAQTPSGEVPDLQVLDGSLPTRSYRRRWGSSGSISGRYVVRRPQAFGADLWGYAELRDGEVLKLLDLPLPGDRWRGCDSAWRLQLAIDALADRPQQYRVIEGERLRLDLFAPIPLWARRRLSIVGEEVDPAGCLMSFEMAANDAAAEERFLQEQVYLVRSSD